MNGAVARALAISLLLSGLALGWVVTRIGDPSDLLALRRIRPGFLAEALGLLGASLLLAGARLQVLARRLGRPLALHHAVRAHVLGMFAATVTPGGSGGLPAVALALQRQGVGAGNAWAAGVAVLSADAVFSAWATPPALLALHRAGLLPEAGWVLPVGVLLSALALAFAFVIAFRLALLERVADALFRGPLLGFRRRALRFVAALLEANRALLGAGAGWHLLVHGLTALSWLAFFGVLWALAGGFGLELGPWRAAAMQLVVTTVSSAVPTPGGSGFFEVAIAYLLRGDGGARGLAATVLSWRLLTYYALFLAGPLLGGYLVLKQVRERHAAETGSS